MLLNLSVPYLSSGRLGHVLLPTLLGLLSQATAQDVRLHVLDCLSSIPLSFLRHIGVQAGAGAGVQAEVSSWG